MVMNSSLQAKHDVKGEDGEVRLWNLATHSRVAWAPLEDVPDKFWAVCLRFSPNGETIAIGSGNQLSVLRRRDLGTVYQYPKKLGLFISLRFSPDGRYLASGHGPGGPPQLLAVWDTQDWSPRFVTGLEYLPPDIAFSPDGSRMVSGGDRLIVWDTDTWQELARVQSTYHGRQLYQVLTRTAMIWLPVTPRPYEFGERLPSKRSKIAKRVSVDGAPKRG